MHKSILTVFFALALWISAFAGPVMTIDSAESDLGIIREGSASSVSHDFKIRNTGDSVLVIRDVRPG